MGVIQHADTPASPRDYEQIGIRVSSIFRTLQGEAPFTGYPAVFLRLAGCNFGSKSNYCQFCDTSFQLANSRRYMPEALVDHLKELARPNDILVLTGGEPSLQKQIIPVLVELLDQNVFKQIQIESNLTNPGFWHLLNGTGRVTKSVIEEGIFVVGSPKANYKTHKVFEPAPETLEVVGALKFLFDVSPGAPSYGVPEWALDTNIPIYVSPVAVYARAYEGELSSIWEEGLIDKKATERNYTEAARYAIENSYKLSLQTHLFAAVE